MTPVYRSSPIAKGGLEIVLRATFKIDDRKRSLLHRLKELIARTTSFFTNQKQMKKNQLLVTMKRICQLCSWLMMKQKRTSSGNETGLGSKFVTFYACKNKFICTLFFFFVEATKIFLSSDIKIDKSLIRVLAMYIMYIGLIMNVCDGVAQESP